MYGNKQIKQLNGTDSSVSQEPEQLSAALVSSGVVIGSASDLPNCGLGSIEGFTAVGEPIKVALYGVTPHGATTLGGLRTELTSRYESDPSLYYGITNRGQDWALVQAFSKP